MADDPGWAARVGGEVSEVGEMGGASPRVLIVEDHVLLAESLKLALRLEGIEQVEAIHVTGRTDDEVVQEAADLDPQVVLLDLYLGSGRISVPLVRPLRDLGARVLVLTSSDDNRLLAECLEAGADGIFDKAKPFEGLVELLNDAARGITVMRPSMREELLADLRHTREAGRAVREPFDRLTEREAGVLAAIVEGKAADEIAAHEYVSESTVRSHIRSILRKLGVNSQLAAVALARRAGWPDSR